MYKLCVFTALVAIALSAPVQEKTNVKRGLALGYGYGGYSLPLDAYHAPLEAYHAPLEAYHAPIISHAPLVNHAPIISHAPALPYHAPLAYSSPYLGFGHYPYFH